MKKRLELGPAAAGAEVVRLHCHPKWPKWQRKFLNACRALNALTHDMQEEGFVGVNLYLQESSMHLMASESHVGFNRRPIREGSAESITITDADGGGW